MMNSSSAKFDMSILFDSKLINTVLQLLLQPNLKCIFVFPTQLINKLSEI